MGFLVQVSKVTKIIFNFSQYGTAVFVDLSYDSQYQKTSYHFLIYFSICVSAYPSLHLSFKLIIRLSLSRRSGRALL